MQLVGFGEGRVGKVVGDRVYDITDLVPSPDPPSAFKAPSSMMRLISVWEDVRAIAESHASEWANFALADLRLLAPLVDPSKIVAAPINYSDHMSEMHETHDVSHLGVFLKAPSSIVGHDATVHLPYSDRRFDQEGELALIVGRRGHDIDVNHALDFVFGYTGLLDITMRGGEDRSTRKSFDTFTPMGPSIVTADEFGDPGNVDLRCWVNEDLRQHARTKDLIWTVPQLISYVSSVMTLEVGDVISTGTPAGVGPVSAGDTIHLELASAATTIGRLSVHVSQTSRISVTHGAASGPVPPQPK